MKSGIGSVLFVATALVVGCGDDDGVGADAGTSAPFDAGESDAGARDAAIVAGDAGSGDAAVVSDAGGPGWTSEPPVPVRIQEITGAVHGGRLWIAGGFDGSLANVATVRIYDPATSTWSLGPDLPAPRHHAMLVSSGTDLFLFGGMRSPGFAPLDTAWVLRDGATTWVPIASLLEPRGGCAAGFVGGRAVIAGGNRGPGVLASSTLVYDPAMDRWTTGAPIPNQREHTSGFVHDDELWVVAGRQNSLESNSTLVDIYDPALDSWRAGPPIPTARGGHGVATLGGFAYAVGGEQPDRALDSVERLDLVAGTWSAITPVPTPRHGHVVLGAAGRLWVIGGADMPIFAAVNAVESYVP